jgi:hypothetical protein
LEERRLAATSIDPCKTNNARRKRRQNVTCKAKCKREMLQGDEASQCIHIYMHFIGIRSEDVESFVLTLDRDRNVHLGSI